MLLNPRVWPWWGWLIAVILLLLCLLLSLVIAVRLQGQAELQRVLADLQSKGLIHLPAEVAARAPAVDADRQRRAWDLQERIVALPWAGENPAYRSSMEARFPTPGATMSPRGITAEKLAADSATIRAEWATLIAEGPVLLSGYGWMAADFPQPAALGVIKAASLRMPNLLAVRILANSQAAAALGARDPRPALHGLDTVVEALQPTASLLDAMILIAICSIRDNAWLEATCRGVDPAPWIARCPFQLTAVADAFAFERAWEVGALYQDFAAGRAVDYSLYVYGSGSGIIDDLKNWMNGLHYRVVAPFDIAFAYQWGGRTEQRLKGRGASLSGMPVAVMADSWRHPLSRWMALNLLECATTAITQDVSAREYRIAAALVWNWRNRTTLPVDAAGVRALLPTDLLAAHGDLPAIQYTVVAPGRFRLWVDPATPATDLLPAGRIEVPKPGAGAWSQKQWWLELDLNQLPPP